MTISVVIPTLDEASRITDIIEQTAGLGFTEIVVVDGGSRDGTAEKAGRSGLALVLFSPPGRGIQMNRGASAVRGDVLLFLHADTKLPARAKASIEQALADPLVLGGRFDVEFDSTSCWARTVAFFMNTRSRLSRIATGDQALFVRRSVFERLEGFAEIPLMEDIEFTTRLKRTGRTAALRDKATTSFRRWERQGPLRTILLMWALRFLYWVGVGPSRLQRWYATVR